MNPIQKFSTQLKQSFTWITSLAFYRLETDGILYQAHDADLNEFCWLKLSNGRDIFISYDTYYSDWSYFSSLD